MIYWPSAILKLINRLAKWPYAFYILKRFLLSTKINSLYNFILLKFLLLRMSLVLYLAHEPCNILLSYQTPLPCHHIVDFRKCFLTV